MSKRTKITLSGKQLLDALSLITGSGTCAELSEAELATEIIVEERPCWRDPELGEQPAGLYASLAEHPEEGLYGPLGDTHESMRIEAAAKGRDD